MENERINLSLNRIKQIPFDNNVNIEYRNYFIELSLFISKAFEAKDIFLNDKNKYTLEELLYVQKDLYSGLIGEEYENSIYNPEYFAYVDKEKAKLLSALALEIRNIIFLLFDKKYNEIASILELFLEIYCLFENDIPNNTCIEKAIYYYAFDYLDISVLSRMRDNFTNENKLFENIILNDNLDNPLYLFKFGEYVDLSAIKTSGYLAKLDDITIDKMANAYTEAYVRGFEIAKKDLKKKKYVSIVYELGFEKIVRKAILNFRSIGLEVILCRKPYLLVDKSTTRNVGCGNSSYNRQLDYDHRFDSRIFFDKAYIERRFTELQKAYEILKNEIRFYSGLALMETFGEKEFEPISKTNTNIYTSKQKDLQGDYNVRSVNLKNNYLKTEEISFTIIAWPISEIAKSDEEYKNIFDDIIKINTLDYKIYMEIQQKIIDALDKASYVVVEGGNGNQTNIRISLHELKNPDKETNFENCLADVNVPLGEIFTSPVLYRTDGILHVKDVFLWGISFKDLKLKFKNGMVSTYECKNFEDDNDNYKLIEDVLLKGHKSLPIGEFAIGTNTLAYHIGLKYGISKKLPILIAEKTGPHFAIGDTCYSHEEDIMTYNPDGKAIIARENECSMLRKENPQKAYFACHTDITIPYHELGNIYGVSYSGERIDIIKDGIFILEGTQKLNEVLK